MNDTTPAPRWVRLAMVALGVPNALAGLWAVLSPQGWFDDFPGWDPRLVAAEPPFNEHLATDAGAGLLASGVLVLAAAWIASRAAARLALFGYGAFAIPHAAWHVFNPSDNLSGADEIQSIGSVVFAAVATVGLYAAVSRGDRAPTDPQPNTERVPA